jgi:RimJ/RimL family protein N-acetyltransferase
MNPLQYRPATANDFDAIYKLYMHPATNPHLAFDIVPQEDFLPTYQKILEEGELMVVLDEKKIIGSYHLFNKEYRQSDTVYLATLVIDPEMVGKGYGRTTLLHIIRSLTAQKKNRIELEVSVSNETAVRFYEKAGFIIEGTIRQSYKISTSPGYFDDYVMGMLLQQSQ